MKRVSIVIDRNERRIKNYLEFIRVASGDKAICYVCGSVSDEIRDMVAAKGFGLCKSSVLEEEQRDDFMREYIDMVGAIGRDNNSRLWWATDVASKNRFTSKLPDLLKQFLEIAYLLDSAEHEEIVVLNPEFLVFETIQDFCKDKTIDFNVYGNMLTEKAKSAFNKIFGFCNIIFNGIKALMKSAYANMCLGRQIRKILDKNHGYYVIKTFIYNNSFDENGNYKDSFFGRLPEHLKDKKDVLIYACILGDYKFCVDKIKAAKEQYNIVPLESTLSAKDVFAACKSLMSGVVSVGNDINFGGRNVSCMLNGELAKRFNNIQPYHYLHYWATKDLLNHIKVETLLLTYENNPWEKMMILAFREFSPETRIIGYQHTIVSQASANMFVSAQEKDVMPLPDKVCTVGKTPKDILEKYGEYDTDTVWPTCGLRFEYLFNKDMSERKEVINVLVALEGIKEAHKLVGYIFRSLGGNEKYRVRIRTHPVLGWDYYKNCHNYDISNFHNFEISEGQTLEDDINWSSVVVYWGSTVSLEALSVGVPVVHYDMGSVFNFDPLFECSDLKWSVSDESELVDVLREIDGMKDAEFNEAQEKARTYIGEYFHSIDEESLNRFCQVG